MKQAIALNDANTSGISLAPVALVLVVEDDERLRELSRRFLEKQNWQVLAAADAAGAMRLVMEQQRVPDIMITDIVLPDMAGPELVRQIHSIYPEMRVLYVSGYAPSESEADAVAPTTEYLQKPFSFETMIRRVKALLPARCSGLVSTVD